MSNYASVHNVESYFEFRSPPSTKVIIARTEQIKLVDRPGVELWPEVVVTNQELSGCLGMGRFERLKPSKIAVPGSAYRNTTSRFDCP
uniref:Uncharacterized protein n=1 Tax=Peronospora matthiolae TaxID=2874970 RepID=A0AAV1U296_9STRA